MDGYRPAGSRGTVSVLIIVTIVLYSVAGVVMMMERNRVLRDASTDAARLARVLKEQTVHIVQAVDLTLTGMLSGLAVAPSLAPHDPAFQRALEQRRDTLPFLRALFVIDADGAIIHDTSYPSTPAVVLADRPYFRVHRDDASAGLSIGPPLLSRRNREWFFSMTRRIAGPGGEFRGVVAATIEPRYFERFYGTLELSGADSISLFHRDGTLYARSPYPEGLIGGSFSNLPLFTDELPSRDRGTFRVAASKLDGEARIISYRAVEGVPLVVSVGLAETPLLAGWRHAVIGTFVGTTITVALLWTVAFLLARRAREREAVRERLAQGQQLEALGRMTGGIAHDFNNILSVAAINLAILRRTSDAPTAPLEAAVRAVHEGTRLASQLAAFARRQPLTLHPLDANALVTGLLPLLVQAAGPSVDITTKLARDLWPCVGDETQFNAAILNLVLNARDAMPTGKGRIHVGTRNVRVPHGADRFPAGEYVRVTVADNGRGMPPAVLRRAAEPFYTTKGKGIGTGLGLSQIYGFMRQVGGDLNIESAVGVGTSVQLMFRRAATSTTTGAVEKSEAS
jgi:signal transduction histidine kinase